MNEQFQFMNRHSLQGELKFIESRTTNCIVQLQEHPLRRQGLYIDLVNVDLDGLACWSSDSSSGYLVAVEPVTDYVSLQRVRSGQINFHEKRRHTAFSTGSVFLWQSDASYRVEHMPELNFDVASIRRDDIARFACSLIGDELKAPIEFSSIPPGTANERGLRFVMATLAGAVLEDSGLAGSPLTVASLKDMVLGALLELCPNNITKPTLAGSAEPKAVALAQAFMRAHMSQPLRVSQIAEASGVSLRSLQTAFRRSTGQSLVEHLRALRLERARLDLMDSSCSPLVSQIAYRWGFNNLSDFSRRYAETYGEHPRTTLRRSRRS